MSRYRSNPEAVQSLVREDRVHRDVYINAELFELEMERLWRAPGSTSDTTARFRRPATTTPRTSARQPVIMMRDAAGEVRVLMNRCAHKGARLVSAPSGHCEAKLLRCPYHGWTYRLDGSIRAIPLKRRLRGHRARGDAVGRGIVSLPTS